MRGKILWQARIYSPDSRALWASGTDWTDKTALRPWVLEQNLDDSVTKGKWRYFGPFEVASGAGIQVSLTGSETDADLYVGDGFEPTEETFTCRPFSSSSNEFCAFPKGGSYWVGVHGFDGNPRFLLSVRQ